MQTCLDIYQAGIMTYMLIRFLLVALTLLALSHWMPGIVVDGLYTALIVALLLGLANLTLKPILTILTLPVQLLTLGLFSFVVNAGIFWFVASFVDGFSVSGFLPALIGSVIIAIVRAIAR